MWGAERDPEEFLPDFRTLQNVMPYYLQPFVQPANVLNAW